jgi:Saccharopine dehydrogenase NADP binding domain
VVIFGGAGTFGRLVARELVRLGLVVVIAGRDRARAEAFARTLEPTQCALEANIQQPDSCRSALDRECVAVNCAGPFRGFGPALLDACLSAGCHYVDIADDRGYAALARGYSDRFQRRGLVAAYGCSSLPGLSGSLGIWALEGSSAPPLGARVTLLIGNNHPKGRAAIESLVQGFGRPILAPQGTLSGFRNREVVALPQPFGKRSVYSFESPEYDLFPDLLGVRSVSVNVGFELRLATRGLATLASLGPRQPTRTAFWLERLAWPFQWLGTPSGVVMTELTFGDGSSRRAALWSLTDGQRMAALPCALVAQALASSKIDMTGAVTAYQFFGAKPLLDRMAAAGFSLECTAGTS